MALKFNEFGTCWFREPGTGPAIFTSPNRSDSKGCKPGKFFVSDGIDGAGVLMDNNGICYFDTPEEALKALQSHRSHASRLARFPEKG